MAVHQNCAYSHKTTAQKFIIKVQSCNIHLYRRPRAINRQYKGCWIYVFVYGLPKSICILITDCGILASGLRTASCDETTPPATSHIINTHTKTYNLI